MSDLENLIQIEEAKLKNLEEQLKSNISSSEREIIYINIKNTQEFIISLYKLKSNDTRKEPRNQDADPKQIVDNKTNNSEPSTNNINNGETDKVKEKCIIKNKLKNKRKVKSVIKRKKPEELLEMNPPINYNISDKNFTYKNKNLKIITKYYKRIIYKKYIHYECSKRRYGCAGKVKYDINNKKFFIIKECDDAIEHDVLPLDEFNQDYLDKDLENYNMSYKKYQRYYIKALFLNNDFTDIEKIQIKFKNEFNTNFKLTNREIIAIKHDSIGKLNTLSIEELLKNIKIEDSCKLEIKIHDIFYHININSVNLELMLSSEITLKF